jgi:energy-coupling factor transporter ATP-binding protein EcfA2
VTDEEKELRVTAIIAELGLVKARNTCIGDEKVRGISGGERKRANVAVQLISNPTVLFMDEPTSGLDSFQAQAIMESMKNLAKNGRLVISVIHQPRSSIFDMFDKLLLLSEGRSMFLGKATDAVLHFERLGHKSPPFFNPSDFFLDILSPDNSSPVIRCSPLPTMGFLGCGHMLRVRMVQEVGSYADFPGHYGSEEKDLCIRFLDRGWSLLALPGVHVWHDKSTAGRDWAAQHRSGTLNDMVFGLLRAPLPELFYYLPGKAFKLVLWGLKGSRKERWSGLAGLLDFVRHAPACLVQRAPVRRSTFRHFTGGDGGKTHKPRDWEGRVR